MATAFSVSLLAVFTSLLCMGMASPVAMDTKDPAAAATIKSAAASTGEGVEIVVKGMAPAADAGRGVGESPLQENGVLVESSQMQLGTEKRLRRQSNRLIRARRTRAAEDTSDEDPLPNNDPSHRDMISCVSHQANNTIPAAHIRGHGTKPFAPHDSKSARLVQGYQQRWQCCEYTLTPSHNAHAFVDGGMIFNQTDKSLRVPVCGYYHISTQIYYQIDKDTIVNKTRSAYHLLKFERNCPSWPDRNPVTVIGKSSVSHDDTTTSTSDVMRLCAGGKVWVEIPDYDHLPCCPIGDEQGTFISAFLIAETSCHWPPDISMQNFNNE